MKAKTGILFLSLTFLLMSMSYLLLDMLDRHFNVFIVIVLSGAVIADLVALTRLFQRFMRS